MQQIKVTCKAADFLPIDSILKFQGKLKKLSVKNRNKLKKSILKNGFCAPIFIWKNQSNNYILDGHQRLETLLFMREEGFEIPLLPVAFIEADDEKQAKEKLLVITSSYGEFNFDELNNWLENIDNEIKETLRFTNKIIKLEPKKIIEKENKNIHSIVKNGDLINLNNHKLLCGNSLDKNNINILLDDKNYHLILTDPPFEMDIKFLNQYKNKFVMGGDKQLIDLIKVDETFKYFLIHYYEFGFARSKNLPQNAHHLIAYFGDLKYTAIDGDILKTVIKAEQIIKDKQKYEKPVEVFKKIIEHYSEENDIILDLFLHSGTTLIACEKLNRVCYGLEIEPKMCDFIINRYYNYCLDNNIQFVLLLNNKYIQYKPE